MGAGEFVFDIPELFSKGLHLDLDVLAAMLEIHVLGVKIESYA